VYDHSVPIYRLFIGYFINESRFEYIVNLNTNSVKKYEIIMNPDSDSVNSA